MNFSSTLEAIEKSKEFKEFEKEHKDAYLCAGFFILDFEQNINQQQLDYSLKDGKIFTFVLSENEIAVNEAETIEGKKQKMLELSKEIKVDLENLKEIAEKRMEKEGIRTKINKIIAILQVNEDKQIWNLTCMTEGLGILQVHIDSSSGEILKFEKRSLFDFVKKVK